MNFHTSDINDRGISTLLQGWEYFESNETCCGECIQVACVADSEIRQSGESWLSFDNCTTFTCENFDNQFMISSSQESCPSLEFCPEENIYVEGCCKRCNQTSASQGKMYYIIFY